MPLASDQAGTTTFAEIFMGWGCGADICANMNHPINACVNLCPCVCAQRGLYDGSESLLWVWDCLNQSGEAMPRGRGKQWHTLEITKREQIKKKGKYQILEMQSGCAIYKQPQGIETAAETVRALAECQPPSSSSCSLASRG